MVAQHWGGGWEVRVGRKMKMGKLKMAANQYGVSCWSDKNVIKFDCDDCCTHNSVNIVKTVELHVWMNCRYMNYTWVDLFLLRVLYLTDVGINWHNHFGKIYRNYFQTYIYFGNSRGPFKISGPKPHPTPIKSMSRGHRYYFLKVP